MRPLLPTDLDAAVSVLLAAPRSMWPQLAAELLTDAETADRARLTTGRAHPTLGNGSLAAAAGMRPRHRLPDWCDATYCAALIVVARAALAAQPLVQYRQRGTAGSAASRSGNSASPQSVQ